MIDLNLAQKLKKQYQSNFPFPYIVIDNFLPDEFLEQSLREINKNNIWYKDEWDWIQTYQVEKYYCPWDDESNLKFRNSLPITNFIINFLNSKKIISFLEVLSGISDLTADHTLYGAGLHKIGNGGKLAIHEDRNLHPTTSYWRRLNLLLYLNKDWSDNYNGNLVLMNKSKTEKVEIEPIFNRVVIFTIDGDSLHGHPTPLNTPNEIYRQSIALYYWTKEKPSLPSKEHGVIFY